jgi:hypothetical protein
VETLLDSPFLIIRPVEADGGNAAAASLASSLQAELGDVRLDGDKVALIARSSSDAIASSLTTWLDDFPQVTSLILIGESGDVRLAKTRINNLQNVLRGLVEMVTQ